MPSPASTASRMAASRQGSSVSRTDGAVTLHRGHAVSAPQRRRRLGRERPASGRPGGEHPSGETSLACGLCRCRQPRTMRATSSTTSARPQVALCSSRSGDHLRHDLLRVEVTRRAGRLMTLPPAIVRDRGPSRLPRFASAHAAPRSGCRRRPSASGCGRRRSGSTRSARSARAIRPSSTSRFAISSSPTAFSSWRRADHCSMSTCGTPTISATPFSSTGVHATPRRVDSSARSAAL